LQQAVIGVKPDEGERREGEHRVWRRGPDRARHGKKVIVTKGFSISALVYICAERQAFEPRHGGVSHGFAVELSDIRQHRQEPRPHQIALLCKQAAEADAAGIFEMPAIKRRRERHVRDLGRNLKMREQRAQIGICRPVEHDEAGVDGNRTTLDLYADCVRMPPCLVGLFVYSNIVTTAQKPCRRQPGYSGSDHCDPEALIFRHAVEVPFPLGRTWTGPFWITLQ
jgi:hypothetical protein